MAEIKITQRDRRCRGPSAGPPRRRDAADHLRGRAARVRRQRLCRDQHGDRGAPRRRLHQDAVSPDPEQGGAVRGHGVGPARPLRSPTSTCTAPMTPTSKQALNAALMACADLTLDRGSRSRCSAWCCRRPASFPTSPATFYRNGIPRTAAALADWLRVQSQARADRTRRCRRSRRHAARHGRIGAAARGDLWRRAAAVARADRSAGAELRGAVLAGMPGTGNSRPLKRRPRQAWRHEE